MPIAKFFLALVGLFFLYVVFVPPVCACVNKTKGYVATTKADLRNLVTAQEAFFAEHRRYANSFVELDSTQFTSSPGSVIRIQAASDSGFLASGTHTALPELRCQLAIGPFAKDGRNDGEPMCTPSYKRPWYRMPGF